MSGNQYDIIYVGAGTSTIFSLAYLLNSPNLKDKKILVLEKGENPYHRTSVTSGWGGAGITSDCKIILSTDTGGEILNYVSKEKCKELHQDFLNIVKQYFNKNSVKYPSIPKETNFGNFQIITNKVLHLGTEYGKKFAMSLYSKVKKCSNIDLHFNEEVINILLLENNKYEIITSTQSYFSSKIIYATGKSGSLLTKKVLEGVKKTSKKAQIGVRVEVPFELTKKWTDIFYDFKFYLDSDIGGVRSFCVAPKGEIIVEDFFNNRSFNGGSDKQSYLNTTNFGIICTLNEIENKSSFQYQREVVEYFDTFPKEEIIVNWGKWKSSPIIKQGFGEKVYTMLTSWMEEFEKITPGFLEKVKIHIPEVKYVTDTLFLNSDLSLVESPNFYCVGDCSYGRGIYQSALGGILVAQNL